MKKNLVIVPAYNEAMNIESVVADIEKNAPSFDYVIINDCSKDNTLEVVSEKGFYYVDLPVNLGIGGAVQTGYKYAMQKGYETAVQIDGDGQHDAAFLEDMLRSLKEEDVDMVIGSRFIEKRGFQSSTLRRIGITYFQGLIKILTGATITDATSGLRLSNRKVIELFAENYPRDYPEPESIITALRNGFKVKEVPVIMKSRLYGESSISLKNGIYYMIKVSLAMVIARIS